MRAEAFLKVCFKENLPEENIIAWCLERRPKGGTKCMYGSD